MSIRLTTLGGLRCYVDGVPTDASAQKLRFALLAYLAVERSAPRESIAALFWPERDEERARHTLAQTIYELRRAFGEDWLKPQSDPLEVTDVLSIDVAEFEQHVANGDLEHALEMYDGDFLLGFHIKGSNDFDSWVETKRRELKRLHHRASRDQLQRLLNEGRLADAVAHAQHWVSVDALDDEANHALIDVLAQSGRRSEALAQYQRYAEQLHAELEVAPIEQTQQLVARIQNGAMTGPTFETSAAGTPAAFAVPVAEKTGFFDELGRRHVFATAAWYGAAAFVAVQAADIVVPALGWPARITSGIIATAALGFPLAIALSWFFNLTRDHGHIRVAVRPGQGTRLPRHWHIATLAFVLVSAAAAAAVTTPLRHVFGDGAAVRCGDGSAPPCLMNLPIDQETYAVLPFKETGAVAGMDGHLAGRLIMDGMSRWNDVAIADPLRVSDALRRRGGKFVNDIPVDSGLAIARSLGAGRLIMGEVWQFGDTIRVRGSLYDVIANGRKLKSREVRFAATQRDAPLLLAQLGDALLFAGTRLEASVVRSGMTSSLSALYSYDRGVEAVDDWNLAAAVKHFEVALQHDSAFTQAGFWLAQTMLWAGDTTAAWRMYAADAEKNASQLPSALAQAARAMAALSRHDYPAACAEYRSIVSVDSLSFAGWLGLGDCTAFDQTVISDPGSPSGWSFRGSHQFAALAYRRAITLVPSFNNVTRGLSASRIARVLYRTRGLRLGASESGELRFAARPQLLGDTLAYIPYPHVEVASGAAHTFPATQRAVLARNRATMRDLALDWVRAFPHNADAYEALALGLESMGSIDETQMAETSAMSAAEYALKYAADAEQRLRLEIMQVRVLTKRGDFRRAARRANEILAAYVNPTPAQAKALATCAALTGRVHLLANLLAKSAPEFEEDIPLTGEVLAPPLPVAEATLRLLAYASFEQPRDSVLALWRRAHTILDAHVAPETRELMHAATLDRAARMLYFSYGPDDVHRADRPAGALIGAQRALLNGSKAAVGAELAKRRESRRGWSAGETTAIDAAFTEVQLYLALGNKAGAIALADSLLLHLETIAPEHFNQPYQTAALVRLMALRVELAQQADDRPTAKRWSKAVKTLWSKSDRDLKPILTQLR